MVTGLFYNFKVMVMVTDELIMVTLLIDYLTSLLLNLQSWILNFLTTGPIGYYRLIASYWLRILL